MVNVKKIRIRTIRSGNIRSQIMAAAMFSRARRGATACGAGTSVHASAARRGKMFVERRRRAGDGNARTHLKAMWKAARPGRQERVDAMHLARLVPEARAAGAIHSPADKR